MSEDLDREAVEAVFNKIVLATLGVPANVGFAAISSFIAGMASVCANDQLGAEELISAIASDATDQMRADFDFFRETKTIPQ